MLSFRFILLLFFGLKIQTTLATSYGLVSDVVTPGDDDHASQTPGNGVVTADADSGDDTVSDNGLDEMTTGASSVDTLLHSKAKGCIGSVCSPSNMCLCRNKSGVRVYCYCENPGQKCSCRRNVLASRDGVDADAKDTVDEGDAVSDVGADGADVSDAVTDTVTDTVSDTVSDAATDTVPSDDTPSEDIDSSDEGTSPTNTLLNKGQCHGTCKKCIGNCKDKYQCLCKGRDVVARCGCERLGEKCQCKGPWRAVRDGPSVNINSTTADEEASATPSTDDADAASEDLDDAAPGVSPISELVERKPTTCHGVMCSKEGKCHCKHGAYHIVCPCRRLGAPCYCKNWRRDEDAADRVAEAAVAETAAPAPETADTVDNTPAPEDEDAEVSERPGFSHAVNDELSTLQRSDTDTKLKQICYGTCSRKHNCNCRGKTCRCQIPGESCKCVFLFLPPRDLEPGAGNATGTITTLPADGTEAAAEGDGTVITPTRPDEDIDEDTPNEDTDEDRTTSNITNNPLHPEEDDPEPETEPTSTPLPTESSPLIARSVPCWGVCDKYRHCYCGHIRTTCNCSKRGHRCYCGSGALDLPPGMGGGSFGHTLGLDLVTPYTWSWIFWRAWDMAWGLGEWMIWV
ncbi:hypothetical protein BO86DRAFT_456477 [Aspergillus japonicus CBS 114.51]|uniref:Uncharacterized protein n=1 Tax=Aspergillus japonicus CBS 114.51 TaxID=1448312 RepID=A0A8T8X1M3_ASPJA|nr:hypothetical protein BO86DRAFT_456477 [Aspergillus japonicus CBS 114.51]RAH81532.1 hypothetical protein BO86DRAFT_456477 [Aspergillus japonicus CBS 114.51]